MNTKSPGQKKSVTSVSRDGQYPDPVTSLRVYSQLRWSPLIKASNFTIEWVDWGEWGGYNRQGCRVDVDEGKAGWGKRVEGYRRISIHNNVIVNNEVSKPRKQGICFEIKGY